MSYNSIKTPSRAWGNLTLPTRHPSSLFKIPKYRALMFSVLMVGLIKVRVKEIRQPIVNVPNDNVLNDVSPDD